MRTVSTTPFGARPVTACLMENNRIGQGQSPVTEVDKWQVFDALTAIASEFDLGDRAMSVLRALISFHPDKTLKDGQPMVVFASNRALGERAYGMPESTLRRHLGALVQAGLILRHDSPNGKRYARRGQGGQITRAFGFDLRPLLVRSFEIQDRAAQEAVRQERIILLREDISLMLRDIQKYSLYAQEQGLSWDAVDDRIRLLKRGLRRKLTEDQLTTVKTDLTKLQCEITAMVGVENPQEETQEINAETTELSGNAVQIERHYQRSNKEPADKNTPPLTLVVEACPDIHPYLDQLRGWSDFIESMCRVAPMTGIDARTWAEACRNMGPENAAATVALIVQRIGSVAKPGAYLRSLSKKAGQGEYSPLPVLMSMTRQAA